MENIVNEFAQAGFESIGSIAKGLKNITIEMENDCTRCHGSGQQRKMIPRIDLDFNPDEIVKPMEMVDCSKCNGSGLQNVIIKVDVTKTAGKKEEKKK